MRTIKVEYKDYTGNPEYEEGGNTHWLNIPEFEVESDFANNKFGYQISLNFNSTGHFKPIAFLNFLEGRSCLINDLKNIINQLENLTVKGENSEVLTYQVSEEPKADEKDESTLAQEIHLLYLQSKLREYQAEFDARKEFGVAPGKMNIILRMINEFQYQISQLQK